MEMSCHHGVWNPLSKEILFYVSDHRMVLDRMVLDRMVLDRMVLDRDGP